MSSLVFWADWMWKPVRMAGLVSVIVALVLSKPRGRDRRGSLRRPHVRPLLAAAAAVLTMLATPLIPTTLRPLLRFIDSE